jgi:beta-glucanase (GH16 family)
MNRRSGLAAVTAILCLASLSACTSGADADATGPGSAAAPQAEADPPAGPAPERGGPAPQPVGQKGGWAMAFSDEFEGTSLDMARWSDRSSAEPDAGRGNLGNQQLEWNQATNCTVRAGELIMTAKREQVTSPSLGQRYDWTSCLITTRKSYAFQYGYIEERSVLPAARGFWPAFWTWQVKGADQQTETDVYEFYSDNHRRLYGTQYSGAQGRCEYVPRFNPSAGWHTYGVAITPAGTTWYTDGAQVCHTPATSDALANIISNLAVYAKIPPAAGTTSATKRVDYIRAWKPA